MKLLFLSDNFPPEVNAPATRTFEHCREWVLQGAEVTVISGAPNFPLGKVYEGYRNRRSEERMDGIRVIRVRTYIAENKGTVRRSLDYLSFYFAAVRAGRKTDCDLIIGTSPQLFAALAARKLSRIKRKPWIMEVRDIWPESIKTVGAFREGPVLRYFEKKERQCYRSAQSIVCVTKGIKSRLSDRGVPENKLQVFTNGANLEAYTPRDKDTALLSSLGLDGKKIVAYIGTLGLSHKLDFILRAAAKINDPDIHFLFIGEGAEKKNLLALRDRLALKNVTLLDGIPKDQVARYLSIADIALVNLRKKELFLGALPSKIFESAAMQKPLLLGLKGEAEDVITAYKAGLCFEPENEADFLLKLGELTKNTEFYMQCAEGCRKLAKEYDRKTIARQMLAHIANCVREI